MNSQSSLEVAQDLTVHFRLAQFARSVRTSGSFLYHCG